MKEIATRCEEAVENIGISNVDLNPFYYKKEDGKIVKDRSPVLYAKVPYKRCWAKLALKIESIYIGRVGVSLQVKVYEAFVKPLEPRKSVLEDEEEEENESDHLEWFSELNKHFLSTRKITTKS